MNIQGDAQKLLQDMPKTHTPQFLKVAWMERNRLILENLLKKIAQEK